MRKAISVTLQADNVLWLRGQAAASPRGSLSEVLDTLVTNARAAGNGLPAAVRSVKGTVDLPDDDQDLAKADAYVRSMFTASVNRPMLVRETPKVRRTGARKRRG